MRMAKACGCHRCGGDFRVPARRLGTARIRSATSGHSSCAAQARVRGVRGDLPGAAPSRPIARGSADQGLCARDGLPSIGPIPLYRQSGIYAREGVAIDRSTMAGWWAR